MFDGGFSFLFVLLKSNAWLILLLMRDVGSQGERRFRNSVPKLEKQESPWSVIGDRNCFLLFLLPFSCFPNFKPSRLSKST